MCRGARGLFCGTCLLNRYGERVEEVLLKRVIFKYKLTMEYIFEILTFLL